MKNKIRCAIVDDERHAITLLENYINAMPNLELVKTFNDPIKALSSIQDHDKIDILFLDVEMPQLSGITLARSLRSKTRSIIFTSAYEQYAVEAFDVRANHFLVKPIKQDKFSLAVMDVVDADIPVLHRNGKNILFIKTGEKGKLTRIRKQDILYFEGAKNYVNMVTAEREQLIYLTLKDIESIFNDDLFYRVHRSHVINARKIEKIVGNTISLGNGYTVQMGESYKDSLMKFLAEKTLLSGRNQ